MQILITGGSGLIGTFLTQFLEGKGHQVNQLSRIESEEGHIRHWDIDKGEIDLVKSDLVDVIIHLAGANVGEGRWTASRKKEIMDSRLNSTVLLHSAISALKIKPKLIISASATGFYGTQPFDHLSIEGDKRGKGFLAEVCEYWENEVDQFQNLGLRVVKLRVGVVLAKEGGAMNKMMDPIKLGIGSPLGSGNQYMNWIHWKDLVYIINHFIENEKLKGTYNAVAPNPETNKTITRLIASELSKPLFMPKVPSFLLKLIFGEMSDLILEGHRVSSDRLERSGYNFQFKTAKEAIHDILVHDSAFAQ